MPYDIRKRGARWCVIKRADGHSMGCHDSWVGAERQRRAIYREEAKADGGESMSAVEETELNEEELAKKKRRPWEGVLATIMSPTSDGRIIEPDVDFRDLPVPFAVQIKTAEGHDGSEVCGRIEELEFVPIEEFDRREDFDMDEVRDGAIVVYGHGTLDGSEASGEAERLLENGAGVSLDGLHFTGKFFAKEDLAEIDTEEMEFGEILENIMTGEFLRGMSGKIAGVTVVNVPAFEEATVMIASAFAPHIHFPASVLTASAAGLAPLEPQTSWFFMDEPDHPVPLTVTEEGQVYGHLALWNQCHAAFASCERPPRSATEYASFHVGQLKTKEGELVNVGRITVGQNGRAKGGHASIILGRQGAMEHYDKTGCVAAYVRAKDGNHGIWLSGAVRSDAPAEVVRDLRANPPSGDWRDYELVAVLSVPVPGFPIPRSEMRLVATGAVEEVAAMIASASAPPGGEPITQLSEEGTEEIVGWSFPENEDVPLDVPTYKRRMQELSAQARAALAEAELKDYSAEERRRMAKSGQALPDGSFPIANCSDAENAIRAQGRADPSRRGTVKAHIRKRVRALGCSGDIFDDYK